VAKDSESAPPPEPADVDVDDLDELNARIAKEAAAATTADKRNPKPKG
jgi:hypothetical protein